MKFLDEVRVKASSGAGGDGLSAFRREKFVPFGGPWGGDGGRGGHVVFEASASHNTLLPLRYRPIVKARPGGKGGPNRRTGANGEDVVLLVPVGTVIKDANTGEQLADLDVAGARFVALEGGRGGRGNCRFTTSTRQAPTYAEPGGEGAEGDFRLELKLLADVGLLGFPNAGKSTLIRAVSAAKPKVASYPFTTLQPSLGVVRVPGEWRTFVMADIPGIIEGAAEGAGLGHQFLRHVERCRVLLHLVSMDPLEEQSTGSVIERHAAINAELRQFDPALATRPQIVLLSKADIAEDGAIDAAREAFAAQGLEVLVASSATRLGLDPLIHALAVAIDREAAAEAQASGPVAGGPPREIDG